MLRDNCKRAQSVPIGSTIGNPDRGKRDMAYDFPAHFRNERKRQRITFAQLPDDELFLMVRM